MNFPSIPSEIQFGDYNAGYIGSNPIKWYSLTNANRWMVQTLDVNFGDQTIDNDVPTNVVFDSYFNKIGVPNYSWAKFTAILAS